MAKEIFSMDFNGKEITVETGELKHKTWRCIS